MKSLLSSHKYSLLFHCFFLSLLISGSSLSMKDYEINDLELNSADFTTEASQWQVSTSNSLGLVYTNCANTYIMGGYEVTWTPTTTFKRTYESLLTHNTLFISIDFYLLGSWDVFDTITITVSTGSTVAYTQTLTPIKPPATWTDIACTDSDLSTKMPITIIAQVPHTDSNATLEIGCTSQYLPGQGLASCGFRNIRILLTSQTESAAISAITPATMTNVLPSLATGCLVGKYKSTSTGTCQTCDSTCENCFDQLPGSCLSCQGDRIYDGTDCVGCDSSCLTCSGPGTSSCLSCNTGYFLQNNGTCTNFCNSPYTQVTKNGLQYCEFPCDSDSYLYSDGSCSTECSSPMVPKETSDGNYCEDPCQDSTLYYYSDQGVCHVSCEDPYVSSTTNFYKVCYMPTKASAIDYVIYVSGGIASVGLMITNLVAAGDPMAILIGTMSMMGHYVKYLNITYSDDLTKRFTLHGSSSIGVDFWLKRSELSDEAFEDSPVPYAFRKYNLLPSFIENYWPTFIPLLVVTGIFLLFKVLEWICKKNKKDAAFLTFITRKKIVIQNFLLTLFYLAYPVVLFYSIVDFKSSRERTNLDGLSACMFIVLIVIGLKVFWVHFSIVKKQQNLMDQGLIVTVDDLENFYKKNETIKVLYRDFKDFSLSSQIYLLAFMGRALLFTLIITLFNTHPVFQSVSITIINVLMIVYLVIKDPLRHKPQQWHQLIYEVILLFINSSVLVMAALDSHEKTATGVRDGLGNFIVSMTILFNLAAILYVGTVAMNLIKRVSQKKSLSRISSITSGSDVDVNSSQIMSSNSLNQKNSLNQNRIEHISRIQNFRPMHLAGTNDNQLSFRGEDIQPPSFAQASMMQDESRMTENSFIKERSILEGVTEQGYEVRMGARVDDSYDVSIFAQNQETNQFAGSSVQSGAYKFYGMQRSHTNQPLVYSKAMRKDKTGPKRMPSVRPVRIGEPTGLQGLNDFNSRPDGYEGNE